MVLINHQRSFINVIVAFKIAYILSTGNISISEEPVKLAQSYCDAGADELIIFDMDGLMFDTERVAILAWDYAGEKMGLGKTGYMVYKTLGVNVNASNQIWIEEFGERYNEEELWKILSFFSLSLLSPYFLMRAIISLIAEEPPIRPRTVTIWPTMETSCTMRIA